MPSLLDSCPGDVLLDLHHGDCLQVLQALPDNYVDSIVTDPPYGLSFMGQKWDYDVPSAEIWEQCLRALKPGGHLLAFAGTRTQHRMTVNIEDAGFDVRDMIAWVYGSGFPKTHNLKDEWEGWGTALKPALEPITVARKPFKGTVAQNVLEHGTGAINIDGCRVETTDNLNGGAYAKVGGRTESQSLHGGTGMNQPGKTTGKEFEQPTGRWPANLIHDGSEEVVQLFPAETGKSQGRGAYASAGNVYGNGKGLIASQPGNSDELIGYGDSGSAARFFYCAKASKADREDGNVHPTVKPTDLMAYLCRLVTPSGGIVLDPFMGSGSTGKAAMREGFGFIGIEREAEYFKIAQQRVQLPEQQQLNLIP